MDWYKFYVADWVRDTAHLPDAEDLAYRRLMDLYFLTERPLPLDVAELARRIRLDWDCVEPVLEEFFVATDKGWTHERWEAELQRRHRQAEVNRRAASKPRTKASRRRAGRGRIQTSVSGEVGSQEAGE